MERSTDARIRALEAEVVDLRFVIRGVLRHLLDDEQRAAVRDDLCTTLEGMYRNPVTEQGHLDLQSSLARIEGLFHGAPAPDDTI